MHLALVSFEHSFFFLHRGGDINRWDAALPSAKRDRQKEQKKVLWAHNSRPGFQQLSLKKETFVPHGGVIIKRYGTLCSFAVSTTPFCYSHNETAAYCLGLGELCALVFPMKTFYDHGWNDMVVRLVSLRLLACNVFYPVALKLYYYLPSFEFCQKANPFANEFLICEALSLDCFF